MMFNFLFTIIWITKLTVYSNYTESNNTVLTENTTQIAILSKTVEINCLQSNTANIQLIIWKFDNKTIPILMNSMKNIEDRLWGGVNGSLIIKKVEYSDSKIYTCSAYVTKLIYEVRIYLIVRGPPNKVYNFTYESQTETSLKFSWDILSEMSNIVQSFNLTLCKSVITKDCTTVTLTYPTYTYTFKNLQPFSSYRSSIVAINDVGAGVRTDLNAMTLPGIPTARAYIIKKIPGSRNVTLTIDCMECTQVEHMKGVMYSYFIKCDDVNISLPFNNISKIQKTIKKLRPFLNYTCSVSAFNGVKHGPIDSVSFRTNEDYPRSTTHFVAVDMLSNRIKVKWRPAADDFGPVTGYLLKVYHANSMGFNEQKPIISQELDRNTNFYEIEGLTSRAQYIINLWTRNSVGLSKIPSKLETSTDRKTPDQLQIVNVEKLENSIIVTWKFTENQTNNFSYYVCFNYGHSSRTHHCISTQPGVKGPLQCHCSINENIHSVNIPLNTFAKNESQVFIWIKISVPSEFCGIMNTCLKLESLASEKKIIKLNENSGHHHLIIGLVIGICIILVLSFLCAFVICKNDAKYLCFSPRPNLYYSRPIGEYIEVYPKQPTIVKILPLEKSPYPSIYVSELVEHINKQRADDGAGFQAEFEAIESTDTSKWSFSHALLKENKVKNRYTNIFPYDHSRVALQNSFYGKFDYINASFIDGFQRQNAYIATQGPLSETIADFWQMVWEQNSEIIVMISNFVERGRSKCEIYWSQNKIVNYGNISVRQVFQNEMAFYTERRFKIRNLRNKKNNKERTIYHYQYTDWRDFDVPPSSLPVLVFVRATINHWHENSGPIVVHCSAGVGRTGTYICIESQIRKLDAEHQINVRGFLEHIRQQRMKLVQTESQYTFIHDALYEYFLYPDREIHKLELSAYISKLKEIDSSGYTKIESQFKKCINFEPTEYDYMESKKRYNIVKNRSEIMPIESRRINLSSEPGIEGSNYINASAIQGYWQMKEFIITQHPMSETEQDFWKMVWDENCSLIILLSSENMHQFWPEQNNNTRLFRWFRVAQCSSEEMEFSILYNFLMSSSREDYALDCTMHCLKRWPSNISECSELLRLLFISNSKKCSGPIVVIDDYGSCRAGIFVAMSSLLHQLRNTDSVNVYFVVKMIHYERPHTFSSSDDLMFIYELLEFVIMNQHTYPFFSRPHQDLIPNGAAHLSLTRKSLLNNSNLLITHYSTLRSKSSTSTSRRRASSVDSEPYGLQTPSPNRKEDHHSGYRISWNVGETRHTPLLSESFMDWPNSLCNGHFNGPSTNASFETSHISDLPVAKIVTIPSTNNANQNLQSSIFNNTANSTLDSSTNSNTVWCTQKL